MSQRSGKKHLRCTIVFHVGVPLAARHPNPPGLSLLSKLEPAEVLAVKSQVKSVSSVWFERQRIKLWEEEDKIGDVIGFSLATSQLVDGISYRRSILSSVERRRWDHYNMAIKTWVAFYLGSILALRAHKRMRLVPDTNRKVVKKCVGVFTIG